MTMDARKEQGAEIASIARIVRKGGAWIVPSRTQRRTVQAHLGSRILSHTPQKHCDTSARADGADHQKEDIPAELEGL